MLDYVVIETNALAALTINAINEHDPGAKVTCVPRGKSFIGTALQHSTQTTMVLKSGVVWRGSSSDVPEVANNYALCASEYAVFADNNNLNHIYALKDSPLALGIKDLSIFIINPELWDSIPETDSGALKDKRTLNMPRYMNHSEDELIADGLPAHECLYYGVLGVNSLALNYVDCLRNRSASVTETIGYLFDHLTPYVNGLDNNDIYFIKKVADKTCARVAKMRDGLAKINGV
ncbi:MAG: hypothetical protein VX061_03870 [Pseudomonadota bacterium]|nr:hypothetical protein [Pseudomonadota bacterium]